MSAASGQEVLGRGFEVGCLLCAPHTTAQKCQRVSDDILQCKMSSSRKRPLYSNW